MSSHGDVPFDIMDFDFEKSCPQGRIFDKNLERCVNNPFTGNYFYVRVKDPEQCTGRFGTDDIGRPGHTLRIACETAPNQWMTQAFRLSKRDFDFDGETLQPRDPKARASLDKILAQTKKRRVVHKGGDDFKLL